MSTSPPNIIESTLTHPPRNQVYRNTYVCNLCLLTLVVSFMADLYPGAPSHNVPISTALLWACSNVDGVRALRRRSFAYALSIAVLVSLFMDVDFLASDLKVPPTHSETSGHTHLCYLVSAHSYGAIDVYECFSKWTEIQVENRLPGQ